NYDTSSEKIYFGWIGGTNNLKYLDLVLLALKEASKHFDITLIVISGKEYLPDVGFEIINLRWSMEKEQEYMLRADIGLMPLFENEITQGKAGFKLIQYMGLGLVSIVSAITVNKEIVSHGTDGFLAASEKDWVLAVEECLSQRHRWQE